MSAPLVPMSGNVAQDSGYREVLRLIGLFRRVMEPYFARYGISQAQWAVLRHVYAGERCGEPALRLADLGGRLLVRPPSVSSVVEKLRVAGLLWREAAAGDGRAKCVRLTDAGRHLVDRVLVGHAKQIDCVMNGLSPSEQAVLRDLLAKLNTHLEHMAPREAAEE